MFEYLIDVEQCPPGTSMFVRLGDKELAVYHLSGSGEFMVSDNACPHSSGNLASGKLDGHVVQCPLHNWRFDLKTGYCVGTDDVILTRYACRIEDQRVYADIEQTLSLSTPPRYDF